MTNNIKNELYTDFYKVVNDIIYEIHCNKNINKYLFYCNYLELNNNTKHKIPLTICLGGAGYKQYSHIFNKFNLMDDNNLDTLDYDLSFSINKYIDKTELKTFTKEINNIINNNLKKYTYKNINSKNFNIDTILKNNRVWIRINCLINNNDFHILELSFWLNNKISDNFTTNDFDYGELFLFNNNEQYYYLLPLHLLVKTTFYAILDYFEMRNFSKCIKYIKRVSFIKNIFNKKLLLNEEHYIIDLIFKNYKKFIKRKYKMINDYPYILSHKFVNINNNGIVKCIYRKMRKYNHKKINDLVEKYKIECIDKQHYDPSNSIVSVSETITNNIDI